MGAISQWVGGATSGSATDVANVQNYQPPSLPSAGSDLYIVPNPVSGQSYNLSTNLTALSTTALNGIYIPFAYGGQIGTSATSGQYLTVAATTINIGYQYGNSGGSNGSTLLRIDNQSNQYTANVYNTASTSAIAGKGPLTILGSHTANTFNLMGGTATVAVDPTESANIQTLNASGTFTSGTGVTFTTINLAGGNITIQSGVQTINHNSGTLVTAGSGTVGSLSVISGTAVLNSTGTITNLKVYSATANLAQSAVNRTITNCTLFSGATLNVNNGVKGSVVFTNPIVDSAGGNYTIKTVPGTNISLS